MRSSYLKTSVFAHPHEYDESLESVFGEKSLHFRKYLAMYAWMGVSVMHTIKKNNEFKITALTWTIKCFTYIDKSIIISINLHRVGTLT